MSNPLVRVATEVDHATKTPKCRNVWLWCPGCDEAHRISVAFADGGHNSTGPIWEWDGNETTPTFSPSLLTRAGDENRCHAFIRSGQWEFLTDSTHKLAGQTVPMIPLPDWLANVSHESR